jgi:FAD/FMN-containing dehydrogenase
MTTEPMVSTARSHGRAGGGRRASVSHELIERLRTALRGEVIDRRHPAYDDARQVWNGLIDRRPGAIARCAGTADVVAAVELAREHRPVVSVRGGGHQVAGGAVCDDGLVIDLSAMRAVWVDPAARRARAQGGVTWGELDRETQLHGLVTPGGEVSTTGIAGFTLGGGMGVLMRAHGLACDNLRSVELVTADGAVRTVSRDEHPELFWAIRGGGRGVGVVTGFEFELHPLGPEVAVTRMVYRDEDARQVLHAFRDLAHDAPETVSPELTLRSLPTEFASATDRRRVVIVGGVHAGPPEDAEAALAPLRSLAAPVVGLGGRRPYVDVQRTDDGLFPTGGRYYMKSHFLDELSDEAIETLLAIDAERPTPDSLTVIRTLGGAIGRVGPDESAYAHRSARFNLSFDATWPQPHLDEVTIGWARDAWDRMAPFASGGVYVNFSGLDDAVDDLRSASFGDHERRLAEIRRTYDPEGLFDAAARAS